MSDTSRIYRDEKRSNLELLAEIDRLSEELRHEKSINSNATRNGPISGNKSVEQEIVSFVPSPVIISSFPVGKILYANSAAEKAFNLGESELDGKSIVTLFRYPENRPNVLSTLKEQGFVDLHELEFVRQDGSYFTSLNSAKIIEYRGATATVSSFTDISSHIEYEGALKESEEKFRVLIEHAPEAIILFDIATQRLVEANQNALTLFKITKEEIPSIRLKDTYAEFQPNGRKSSEMTAEIYQKILNGDAPVFEWTYMDSEGQPILCEVRFVRFEAGGKSLMRGSIVDIRERRRLEDLLMQSQKMETVGQLTGGVAHDFNNILAVVLGNAELLQDTIPDTEDQYHKLVNAIIRSASRGADLTHQLLAFSRKQPLAPQVLEINNKINELPEMLSRVLGETIETTFITDKKLWQSYADPGQLNNSIMNLCVNARDAMPNGGSLTIETSNISLNDEYAAAQLELEAGDYVRIAVSDTGVGMSADTLSHVFEPFFTTKPVGSGTGLGLSMVFGFAKQSNGHVSIYSEENHGTTVKLYLPRTIDQSTTVENHISVEREGKGETILVVEDDSDVRLLAVSLLSSMGYEIIEAKDGPSAMSMLQHHKHIDLLFSDVILPGDANGADIARVALQSHPGIEILFMSGYTEDSMAKHNELGEGARLLQKPFRKVDLSQAVFDCLDKPDAEITD